MMDHLKKVICTIITNICPQRIKPLDRISRKKYCANSISIFFDVFSEQILHSYNLLLLVFYYGVVLEILQWFYYKMYLTTTKQHLSRSCPVPQQQQKKN